MLSQSTAHELIEKAKLGDASAFEALYREHKDRVFRLCVRLTNSVSDSEDLTQEVFLHAYRHLHGFRGEARFSTWLHRVAINTVMMFLRSRRNRSNMFLSDFEWNSERLLQPSPRPPSYGYKAFTCIALTQAIATLPERRRLVMILHDIHGLTHAEVGSRLCITSVTSKSQLHYAHVALRDILNGTNRIARA
jgi:RNA polymerase sigma-70 factor (ECF subfamily)